MSSPATRQTHPNIDSPNQMRKLRRASSLGQGMMEYIVIVALIAIAAIAVYSSFGKTARTQTAGIAKELSGNAADTDKAREAANAAAGRANDPQKEGMGQYNYANDAK